MSGWLDLKCTVIKGGMKMLPNIGPSPLVSPYGTKCTYIVFLNPEYANLCLRYIPERQPHLRDWAIGAKVMRFSLYSLHIF